MSPKWQPALVGGLFIGVLSALPIIGAANCCCLWIIGGGVVAAYLMQNASPTAMTVGDGALAGLVAGISGAVVYAVVSIPLKLLMAPFQSRFAERILESSPDMPDAFRVFMRPDLSGAGFVFSIVAGFFLMLVLGAIFSTVGGMIGAAIFSRGKPALVPPAPPTYQPPPADPPYEPPPPPPAE
jgi:hypothetical protein